jgi:hypothetical protein
MIELAITSRKPKYAPQEPVEISLGIVNRGDAAVDLPNPKASGAEPVWLVLPAGATEPAAVRASELNVKSRFVAAPPERISIAAGGEWRGVVSLARAPMSGAGEYRIAVRIDGVTSEPIAVTVDPLTPMLAAAGYGVEPLRAGDGQVLILHGGRALYRTRYTESRPSIAESRIDPPTLFRVFDAPVFDVGLPLRTGAFYDEPTQWMVWRQPGAVYAVSSAGDERRAEVPANVARLAHQPFKRTGEAVQVVTAGDDPPEATLLLFPHARQAAAEPAWTLPLEAPATGIALAAGKAGDGHVAGVSATQEGVLVQHVRYEGFRIPDAFNSVLIPGCRPVPGGAIGVRGNADGSAHLGLFVIAEGESQTVAFVELSFPAGEMGSIAATTPLGKFDEPPTASAVHYFTAAGATEVRTAALLAVPGKGLLRLVGGALRPVAVQGKPTNPILLVPGKDVTFVVYLRPNGAPYLEPI